MTATNHTGNYNLSQYSMYKDANGIVRIGSAQ